MHNRLNLSLVSRFLITVLTLATFSAIGHAQATPYAQGRLLVKFKHGVSDSVKHQVLSAHGASRQHSISDIGVDVVSISSDVDALNKAVEMSHEQAFEFVEPDGVAEFAAVTPNDPWFSAAHQWGLFDINCPTAWTYTVGSPSIIIAILDTGVDAQHPDLAPNLVPGWNPVSNNTDTSDSLGHGTAVAGVAGAAGNNGIGIAGVAWNCKLMPVKTSNPDGTVYYSNMASGITWAANHGARVANLSCGIGPSATVDSAASYFRSKGGVLISASGNSGLNTGYTADNPYFLTVGATDYYDNIYGWSSFGVNVDLCAPGDSTSTDRTGSYSAFSGTSAAAPFVSGVAALVLSANPNLTPAQVDSILESTAKDLGTPGWDMYYGYGRVDAAAAVQQALALAGTDTTPPTVSFTQPTSGQSVSGTVTVLANASDNNQVGSVTFYMDGVQVSQELAPPYSYNWDTTTASNGSHTLKAVAVDLANNSASTSISVTVANGDVTPPTISFTSPTSGSSVSRTVSISASASDNVGVASVTFYVDGAQLAVDTSAPYTASWNASAVANGSHTITATAADAAGNTATASVTVTVNNPDTTPPTVTLTAPNNGAGLSGTVAVSATASDNVGVASVSFYCDGALIATDTASPYTVSWDTTKVADGSHTVSAVAKDAAGNSATSSISVTVSNNANTSSTLAITIASPSNGTVITKMSTLKVSSNVSDKLTVTKVEMYLDGALVSSASMSPWTCSFSTRKIATGSHSVYTKAYDSSGATAVSQTITVVK